MGRYSIEVTRSAMKELEAIPKADLKRILARIKSLADEPRPPESRKLCAQERYRIRQGNYRILYTINDTQITVVVVRVGHRREAYRS